MRRRSGGFILLMVLVLLALAATALAGVCRTSMRNELAVQDEVDDLQRRWGVLSCREAVLPQAELLLRRAELAANRPVRSIPMTVSLGGQTFAMVVADEQAKIDVNTVYASQGRPAVERVVRNAAERLGGGGRLSAALRADLRPGPASIAFGSFGQLFTSDDPARIERVSDDLSCWGDGKLMLQRASATALEAVCEPIIGVAGMRRIEAIQSVDPTASVAVVLSDPQIAQTGQTTQLNDVLTDVSHCHSLWIMQTDRAAPGRASYHFAISEESEDASAKISCFSW